MKTHRIILAPVPIIIIILAGIGGAFIGMKNVSELRQSSALTQKEDDRVKKANQIAAVQYSSDHPAEHVANNNVSGSSSVGLANGVFKQPDMLRTELRNNLLAAAASRD